MLIENSQLQLRFPRDLLEKIGQFEEKVFEKDPPLATKQPQLLVPLNTGGGDRLLQMVCEWGVVFEGVA